MHTPSPAIERGFFLGQIEKEPLRGRIMRVRTWGSDPGVRAYTGVCVPALRPARACTYMGVCVTHIHEAILSRSKGLYPLGWCVGIVGGIGFVRRSLGVVSVPPMVVCGVAVLLWGFVRAWIVRPLLCTEAGSRAVACTPGCSHTCTCTYRPACVPTCVRGCCACLCKRANLCTCSLA
jgi:hypothetical protein